MKARLKSSLQSLLRHFGYELRKGPTQDPFAVQRSLISVPEPVVFDVGAHTGSVAAIYRKTFPSAFIYCFEPFPKSFEVLQESAKRDSRMICREVALSDRVGKALLNSNLGPLTNSLLTTDDRGASFWGAGLLETIAQMEVPTTTVDTFCLEATISHVDCLKLDVQGAEFSVLTGATEMLSKQRISLVYCELITCPTYRGQHKLHEYLAFLDSLGYELLDVYFPERCKSQLIQVDAVFLNSRLREGLRR